jgi:hypothetical protein
LSADEAPPLDAERIFAALDRHRVAYLLVGGLSANAYGARRLTKDFDCLPARNEENLRRLAFAMKELNARLRVEGLTDYEARKLPVQLDHVSLGSMEISTWRTDAGDLDILCDMPDREGQRRRYEDLEPRSTEVFFGKVRVRLAALDDVIDSKRWANRGKDREALVELDELRARLARRTPPRAHSPAPAASPRWEPPAARGRGVEL